MILHVTVKPGSKKPGIDRTENGWVVRLQEPALEGKANQALLRAVAEELGIAKSRVKLLRGERSRQKTLSIDGDLNTFGKSRTASRES